MPRQEFIKELQIREKELIEQLQAIRLLKGTISTDAPIESNVTKGMQLKTEAPTGTPKGENSWEDYVVIVLKEIGGKGKSQDVCDAILRANPEMDKKRVLHAVRHHLSKQYREKVIGANTSSIKSQGYEYFILK